ncbi:hypothetical protein [Streptomyces sp. PTD5-9]|uniref:hypothetical protein n=1 Tax=Streptomyces sp. PTD5-9 TaxID=3120150 RepID=UPI00300947CC
MSASGESETERARRLAREAVRRLAPEELAFFEGSAHAYFEDPARVARKARSEPLGIGIDAIAVTTLTAFALPVAATVASSIATDVMRDGRRRGWRRRRRARADDAPAGGADDDSSNPFATPGAVRPVAPADGQTLGPADLEVLRRIAYQRGVTLGLPPGQARLLADAIVGGVVGAGAEDASDGDGRDGRTGESDPS